jgi:DNA polymerase
VRCKPRGDKTARIAFVGEAPGEEEDRYGLPFMGSSGDLMKQLCQEAGFDFNQCFITNVFMDRPEGNRIEKFCGNKFEVEDELKLLGWDTYPFEPLSSGNYVMPYRCLELFRLREELLKVNPNIVVPLGNTAIWAVLQSTGIAKWRGAVSPGKLIPFKCLPTYHPAFLFRAWHMRLVVLADLIKVFSESKFPEISYSRREIWISPTLSDIETFLLQEGRFAKHIAVDIETHTYQSAGKYHPFISMVCFATSSNKVLVVPFIKPDGSEYWPTLDEEQEAWKLVQEFLDLPGNKIFQNGAAFDVRHLSRYALRVMNYNRDTMYKHHALYPGMQKGLGFMGSLYANEGPWKQYRPKTKVEKAED